MQNVYLDKEQILALFAKLDQKMLEAGIEATLFVVGGAAIALSTGTERVTTDIDASYDNPGLSSIIAEIAAEEGLPKNWLNNSIRHTLSYFGDDEHPKTVYSAQMLSIQVASPEFILAMKLASRRPKDGADIALLMKTLDIASPADLIEIVKKYFKADLSAGSWQQQEIERFLALAEEE
jgi:hypothetical protein